MFKDFKFKLLLSVVATIVTAMSPKLYAQEDVNFAYVPVDITSCVSMLDGAVEAVNYTLAFPSAVTTCVGGMDVSIFYGDLNTPVAQLATSAFTIMATSVNYSGVAYIAPVAPCSTPGATCATAVVFSCYEPSISTVYIGGNGSTCS